jgi:hypothetical protein
MRTQGGAVSDDGRCLVVWVSDRCHLVCEVPPMGLPQVLSRSIPTSTVCQGDTESRDDLFKDLPAYEKYHPR